MISDPKYCPQCGAALEAQQMGDRTRPVCPQCGFVFYLNPIVAAGALVEQDGRVALVQRGVEPGRGRWCLPSGYVELNESAEEAAVRETWEELRLRVELDGLLNTFSFTNPSSQGVLLIYAAHPLSGEMTAGDDAINAAWFGPDELPDVAFRQHREVLHQWRQARSVAYRRATMADAEVVVMLSEVHAFEYGSTFAPYISDADKALFVAIDNQQVVGFAAITMAEHNRTAQLESVFVIPRYRRWGIGTRLVQVCLDFSRENQIQAVLALAPIAGLGWTVYVKSGFRVSGFTNDYYAPRANAPESALFLTCNLE